MQEKSSVKVTVMLTPSLVARLDARASQDRRSRSNLAALLIEESLVTDSPAGVPAAIIAPPSRRQPVDPSAGGSRPREWPR
jgi:hypothetical protein